MDDSNSDNVVRVNFGASEESSSPLDLISEKKKKALEDALESGLVHIVLTPWTPGVKLPKRYMLSPDLMLKLSYNFAPFDLELSDEGVRTTLSFSQVPFECFIPWKALIAIYDVDKTCTAFGQTHDD